MAASPEIENPTLLLDRKQVDDLVQVNPMG